MKFIYSLFAIAVLAFVGSLGYLTYAAKKATSDAPLAAASSSPPGGYVPVLYFYVNGRFVKLNQIAGAEPNLMKCLEEVQGIIAKVMESPDVPPGGGLRGACLPVPSSPETLIHREPDRANHDSTPEDLGGHPSTTI